MVLCVSGWNHFEYKDALLFVMISPLIPQLCCHNGSFFLFQSLSGTCLYVKECLEIKLCIYMAKKSAFSRANLAGEIRFQPESQKPDLLYT